MTESETKESVDEVSLSENVRASEPEQINDKAVEADLKVKETPESADSKAADEIELEKPEPKETPDKPQEETEKSATEANEPQENTKEAPVAPNDEEVRPALPKRKTSTQNVHENPILAQLTEAFPGIDAKYVKAVLIASQGALDPAFNALLFLSDPSFEAEATVPTAVPQSSQSGNSRSPTAVSQLQQDEILARQLDAQFNKGHARRGAPRSMDDERRARERRIRERQREFERRTAHGAGPLSPEEQRRYERMEAEDQEDNDFLSQLVDKDLPELREKVGRQVQETGRKVNDWLSGFRKNWAQDQSSQQQSSQYPEFSDRQQSQRRDTSSRRSSDSEFEDYTRPEHRTARFNSFGAKVGDDSTTSSAKLACQSWHIALQQG